MAAKILVPLKKHDRVEEIVPYIEKVAEPGASVVFLVHHPVNGFKWLQALRYRAMRSGENARDQKNDGELFSRDAQATGSTPGVSNL